MRATTGTPIKIAPETDQLVSQAAHFLGLTKKDVVDRAVRDYVEANRVEIADGIREALNQLDGTVGGVVGMLTGISPDRIAELGGLPKT